MKSLDKRAGMMELADVTDSKSVGLITRAGSTPAAGIEQTKSEPFHPEIASDFVFLRASPSVLSELVFLFFFFQAGNFLGEGVDILEFAVNRGKTDVRHRVELFQLLHNHFAYFV